MYWIFTTKISELVDFQHFTGLDTKIHILYQL